MIRALLISALLTVGAAQARADFSDSGVIAASSMVILGTATFQGGVTFTSSMTVGNAVWTTTADYSSIMRGGCATVASTQTYGAGAWLFTNLKSTYTYMLSLSGTSGGTSAYGWSVQSNGHTSNYKCAQLFDVEGSVIATGVTNGQALTAGNASGSTPMLSGSPLSLSVSFRQPPGSPYVNFFGLSCSYVDGNSLGAGAVGGGCTDYNAAPMSSLYVNAAGMTLTGVLELKACWPILGR